MAFVMSSHNKKLRYCESCDGMSIVISICTECQQALCESCIDDHKQLNVSCIWLKITKDNTETGDIQSDATGAHCYRHKEEYLTLYCFECNMPICKFCFDVLHKSHKCSDVQRVASEFRRQMSIDVNELKNTNARHHTLLQELQALKRELGDKFTKTEKAVIERAKELKCQIDRDKKQNLDELEAIRLRTMDRVNKVIDEVKQRTSFTESLQAYIEDVSKEATAIDIVREKRATHERAEDLLKINIDPGDFVSVYASFKPTASAKNENSVGRIITGE